jgi:hypothetical protein
VYRRVAPRLPRCACSATDCAGLSLAGSTSRLAASWRRCRRSRRA